MSITLRTEQVIVEINPKAKGLLISKEDNVQKNLTKLINRISASERQQLMLFYSFEMPSPCRFPKYINVNSMIYIKHKFIFLCRSLFLQYIKDFLQ